jgi:hypothetical protein
MWLPSPSETFEGYTGGGSNSIPGTARKGMLISTTQSEEFGVILAGLGCSLYAVNSFHPFGRNRDPDFGSEHYVMLDLPILPPRYSPTRASLQSYIQDITEFFQSPLVIFLIASHPNQISTSQPYAEPNIPEEWLDWWEFFDVLGEDEAFLEEGLSSGSDGPLKPLRRLVSAGELPVSILHRFSPSSITETTL